MPPPTRRPVRSAHPPPTPGAPPRAAGQAVGPLEGDPPLPLEVLDLAGDPLRRQALGQRRLGACGEGGVREGPCEPGQEPVPVDRGVPVVAAVERRGELPRRRHVPVPPEHVGDLVRILLVDAGKGQLGEAGGALGGELRPEGGLRREDGGEEDDGDGGGTESHRHARLYRPRSPRPTARGACHFGRARPWRAAAHSCRSTSIGSVRLADRAGSKLPATAVATRIEATAAKVTGSAGAIP